MKLFLALPVWLVLFLSNFSLNSYAKSVLESSLEVQNLIRTGFQTVSQGQDNYTLTGKTQNGSLCSFSLDGLRQSENPQESALLMDLRVFADDGQSETARTWIHLDKTSAPKILNNTTSLLSISQTEQNSSLASSDFNLVTGNVSVAYVKTVKTKEVLQISLNNGRIANVLVKNDEVALECIF